MVAFIPRGPSFRHRSIPRSVPRSSGSHYGPCMLEGKLVNIFCTSFSGAGIIGNLSGWFCIAWMAWEAAVILRVRAARRLLDWRKGLRGRGTEFWCWARSGARPRGRGDSTTDWSDRESLFCREWSKKTPMERRRKPRGFGLGTRIVIISNPGKGGVPQRWCNFRCWIRSGARMWGREGKVNHTLEGRACYRRGKKNREMGRVKPAALG